MVYLLVCECAELLANFAEGAQMLPTLRARLCGYVGIYRRLRVGHPPPRRPWVECRSQHSLF